MMIFLVYIFHARFIFFQKKLIYDLMLYICRQDVVLSHRFWIFQIAAHCPF